MELILASGSPRRRELMTLLGLPFRVYSCPVDETPEAQEEPVAYVQRLAQAKAQAVHASYALQAPEALVVGADTTVVLDGEVLGKPADTAAAQTMLGRLSGRTHQVLTGLALLAQGQEARVTCRTTQVSFHRLSAAQIRDYCATSEPYDKAGSYGVQGFGACFVAELQGSYHNVVGLPVDTLGTWLEDLGLRLWQETRV